MKRSILILAVLLLAFGSTQAVDLKPTPVNDLMKAQGQIKDLEAGAMLAGDPTIFDAKDPKKEKKKQENALDDATGGRKSPMVAGLLSAALPGLGESYVGKHKKARYFFATEAVGWLAFFGFRTYSSWKEDDYVNLAREKAGIDLEGAPDYLIDFVGFYDNVESYNEFGRAIDRSRPYLGDAASQWAWDSPNDKAAFRHLKNRSSEAFRRSQFALGALVLARLASIIDAILEANRSGTRIEDITHNTDREFDYALETKPVGRDLHVSFSLIRRF